MRWNPVEQVQDVVNKFGTEERVKRFQSGELVLVERTDPRAVAMVLNFERKVSVASRRFVTGESFTKSNPKVKFGHIDEKVVKLFGKSQDVPAGELATHTLLLPKHDPEIMVALGPQSRRFIKLGQFYQLIEAQGQGQEGSLLVNGCANIAYILDENGAPWAVSAYWGPIDGDWRMCVNSVARLHAWLAGSRVLSQVG
ncbi:MAG: hypothetical protein HYX21_02910 [Candidatus Yanofskybacteria bacterium]|nr:hypothetical protein [Candidatus Yanofskybacteria bacterium]